MENSYYVYQHIRLDTEEVFYVGKGKGKRAYAIFGRNKYWVHVASKAGYRVEITQGNLTEQQSFDVEIETIACYRELGYVLCNMTKGGGGGYSGFVHSAESRVKMSAARVKKSVINNFGEVYDSIADAVRETGVVSTNISACCHGKLKSAGTRGKVKIVWVFEENKDNLEKRVIEANNNKPSNAPTKPVMNNFGYAYDSIGAAARETGCSSVNISRCCKGKLKYTGNYNGEKIVWVFKVDRDTLGQRVIEANNAHDKKPKPVTNNFGDVYESAHLAARVTGVDQANISACCLGKATSAGKRDGVKLIWSFV